MVDLGIGVINSTPLYKEGIVDEDDCSAEWYCVGIVEWYSVGIE